MTDKAETKTLAGAADGVTKASQLPPHFPAWAGKRDVA